MLRKISKHFNCFIFLSVMFAFIINITSCTDPSSPVLPSNSEEAVIAFSSNSGETWELINVDNFATTILINSFNSGNTILTYGSKSSGYEIGRSTNGGDNWINVYPISDILAMSPTGQNNNGILVGTEGRIFRTNNDCTNLNIVPSGISNDLTDVAFNTLTGTGIIAGTNNLLRSSDQGNSWIITAVAYSDSALITQVDYTADGFFMTYLYKKYYNAFAKDSILKSSDDGLSWYTTPVEIVDSIGFTFSKPGKMAFRSHVTGLIVMNQTALSGDITESKIIRTMDGGYSWIYMNTGTTLPVTALKFTENAILASTYEGKILRSIDFGNSWQTIELGGNYIFQDIYEWSPGHIFMSGNKYTKSK